MNKKFAVILTVISLTFSLSACGKDDNKVASEETPEPTTVASPSPTVKPTITPTTSPDSVPTEAPKETSTPDKKPTQTQAPAWTPAPTQAPVPTQAPLPTQVPEPTQAPTPKPSTNVNAISEKILSEINMGIMAEVSNDMIKDMYYIDPSIVKQFSVKMPAINVKANEFAIFEVNNPADLDKVQQGMEKRVENLKKQWEHYLPTQYELVKAYKIQRNGNYIILAISEKQDKILSIFNSMLN